MVSTYCLVKYLLKYNSLERSNRNKVGESEQQTTTNNVDLQKCRVCLQQGNIPIFNSNLSSDISKNLYIIGDIKVTEEDEYPKFLCKPCFDSLQAAIAFRQTAKKTDLILQNFRKKKASSSIYTDDMKMYKSKISENQTTPSLFEEYYKEPKSISLWPKCFEPNKKQLSIESCGSKNESGNRILAVGLKEPITYLVPEQAKTCEDQKSLITNIKSFKELFPTCNVKEGKIYEVLKTSIVLEKDKKIPAYAGHFKIVSSSDDGEMVQCLICKKILKSSSRSYHFSYVHKKHLSVVCEVCGKTFKNKHILKQHVSIHSKDFKYKCDLCPYKGKRAALLQRHMTLHTDQHRYMCTLCPKQFRHNGNLHKHLRRHEEPQFKCDICSKTYYGKQTLKSHIESAHSDMVKERVPCHKCGTTYANKKQLYKHEFKIHKRKRMPGRAHYYKAEQDVAVPK